MHQVRRYTHNTATTAAAAAAAAATTTAAAATTTAAAATDAVHRHGARRRVDASVHATTTTTTTGSVCVSFKAEQMFATCAVDAFFSVVFCCVVEAQPHRPAVSFAGECILHVRHQARCERRAAAQNKRRLGPAVAPRQRANKVQQQSTELSNVAFIAFVVGVAIVVVAAAVVGGGRRCRWWSYALEHGEQLVDEAWHAAVQLDATHRV
jgi:hypothetical protein